MKRLGAALILVTGVFATAAVRPASPLTFDPSKIRIAADSFEVYLGQLGQTMRAGTERVEVSKEGPRFIFSESIAAQMIGVTRAVRIVIGAGLEPIELTSHGSFQGAVMGDSVTVRDGKATGSMQQPSGPGTFKTTSVDATVTAQTLFDEDLLIALLPTAELTEGAKASLTVVDGASGKAVPMEVTVEGTETITVPAGKFDVVRVRAKSTDVMVAYVSTTAPRRVVRVNYLDAGIEIRLMK